MKRRVAGIVAGVLGLVTLGLFAWGLTNDDWGAIGLGLVASIAAGAAKMVAARVSRVW